VEERASVVDELKQIRQSLAQSLSVADNFLRKLRGPVPMDSSSSPKETSESLTSIVADIKRQSNMLGEMLATHRDILGDIGENASPALAGRAVGGRG